MKILKGDTVLIISGKNKGKKGKVLKNFPKDGKLIIEGVNFRKKHMRPKKAGEKGQMIQIETPFFASNVKIICSKCANPVRIGYKVLDGKKYRICKKCGQTQ